MKILLIGKNGQVGWELQRTLAPLGEVVAPGRKELDLIDGHAIRRTVRSIKPDLIINAAAYNAVDKAEGEADLAMTVNGIAPGILAEEAAHFKTAIIHYSTDYVFDGTKEKPYTEEDTPNPVNMYGRTKLVGERNIQGRNLPYLIFRTSWVYGLRGHNFLLTILNLAREKAELRIVNDQYGSPTWCRMIAEITAMVISKGAKDIRTHINKHQGIYNLSASGQTTWCQFAENILLLTNSKEIKCKKVVPISSSEYLTLAQRPSFSVLDNHKLFVQFGLKLPSWSSGIELAFSEFVC